ncbi:MAG: hypothetical protein WCV80_03860 [Candidatus Paceibacterota bacterium]|jgi:hypothetical protein
MKKYQSLIMSALILASSTWGAIVIAQTNTPVPLTQAPDEIRIAANESWSMNVQSVDSLRLAARIEYDKPAGGNPTFEVYVNDVPVTSALQNKSNSFTYKDGRTFSYQSGNAWMLFYNPNFSSNNTSAGGGYQVVTDPGQAYLYKWNISSLVKGAPSMKLRIVNNGKAVGKPIIVHILSKYPIPELGNCTSESACRTYCSDANNYAACSDYGAKNNIISKEDAARAKEYADVLKGEGPGACKDEKSCRSYCEGVAHLDECLSFAEKHNFVSGDQLAEAKKVSNALKQGATLPGSCTDKASCDSYCKVAGHIEECLGFAKKAGFLSDKEIADAEKVLPFLKSGETPGACTTKDDCEKYCADTNHSVECINFAEKAGFATKEEADMVRATGGKGPGSCTSKDSCEKYCNAKENQKECFTFAQKYNLIPADKLKEMQDGMGRLRSGIDQMPAEAIACLKDNLGTSIVGDIQSGNFTPGPQTGEIIKGCFDKILPQLQEKLQQGLTQATPATLTCLKSGMGEDEFEKVKSGEAPTPENGDVFRKCFETMKVEGLSKLRSGLEKMPPEIKSCITDKLGADKVQKIQSGENVDLGAETGSIIQECVKEGQGALEQKMQEGLKNAPPEMQSCIKDKLGNIGERMQSGELSGEADVQKLIQECVSSFKPQGIPSGMGLPAGITPGGGAPDAEDLKKMQEQYQNMIPGGIPGGVAVPPNGGLVPNLPPEGFTPPPEVCAQFAAVPSCSYVPASAKDICEKCKGD